jgi:hypothetical protein
MNRFSSVVVTATLTAGCALSQHSKTAPAPDPVLLQDQQEDIGVFRSGFLAVDRSYSPSARAEAQRRLSALERAAGSTSSVAFSIEICRIAALADNGHSICSIRGNGVGLVFSPIGEGFYVLRATSESKDLLGAQLLAIDRHSMERTRGAIRLMAGGVPTHRDLVAAPVLARPDLLCALGVTRTAEAATYRLRTLDGHIVDRRALI